MVCRGLLVGVEGRRGETGLGKFSTIHSISTVLLRSGSGDVLRIMEDSRPKEDYL